jgi:2-polyprenyl-3-methyl-5-hydroxy-6-metoxy-1,4-benzoquinol methylase
MSTEGLDPATFDDVDWERVTHLTVVPFVQDDDRLVLVPEGDRLVLPSGVVHDDEDAYLDATLRIPLEIAGFRKQFLAVLAAKGDRVALWSTGDRYDGDRPHRDVEWWMGEASTGASRLRDQGDRAAADLVELADDARRSLTDDEYFSATARHLESAYLDPRHDNPRKGSGFGGSEQQWFTRRSHLRDAVDRDGTFLDVGCANGLLLEDLVGWCAERGHRIDPYGVDLSAGLVDEATRRLPQWLGHFFVGNALTWTAPDGQRFDFVHALLDLVPTSRRRALVTHLRDEVVRPGGRLVVSSYGPIAREDQWPRTVLEQLGFTVAGETDPDRSDPRSPAPSAWIDV